MPARFRADDGQNVVIRPLIYCTEKDIAGFAHAKGFPIIPCNLCGSQPNLQRRKIKELLAELEHEHPHIKNSLFAATRNVRVTHLLDHELLASLGNPDSADVDEDDLETLVNLRVPARASASSDG